MPTAPDILSAMLAPGGPVARAMHAATGDAFEARPQQRSMALRTMQTLDARAHLLVEAGTGTGKSFAYLLPAALRAVLYGETVVIATHTISLQEQLVGKDIPIVQRVLELLQEQGDLTDTMSGAPDGALHPLRSVLVKGRGNYVSIRRLRMASERQEKLFSDAAQRRSLHQIEDWAYRTTDGTLSSLPPIERMGIWDKVQSDSGNCMGKTCPNYEACFYQTARRSMEGANLLVCNHALFFSDLALRSQDAGFLPAYQHVIFDEAHNVEEVAGEHFGASLSEGRVQHLLTTLYQPRTGKGYLPQLTLSDASDTSGIERAIALVVRAQDACRAFYDDLVQLLRKGDADAPATTGKGWTQRAYQPRGNEPQVLRLRKAGVIDNALTPIFRELVVRLRALRDEAKFEPDRFELNSYAQRAEMIGSDADTLTTHALPACAYWVESTGGDDGQGHRRITLACAPIEVAELLRERLFRSGHSVVLTSATIATRTARDDEAGEHKEAAFSHAIQRLGCDGAGTLQLSSPFDYAKQVELFVDLRSTANPPAPQPHDTRRPKFEADPPPQPDPFAGPAFAAGLPWDAPAQRPPPRPSQGGSFGSQRGSEAQRLAPLILDHVVATEGGAFVLFTSFATLLQCATSLSGPLSQRGLPLLAQGRDGSRTLLLQRFRDDPRSVLFGAASFWQGVDVRGRGLRNVIITKLPFDPPDRPLTQARLEAIELRGGNAFMEESVPRAIIKFKQGFGRLIRSSTDHGRVAILDPRVQTARYGRLFLQALPVGTSGSMKPTILTDRAEL
jgi:ATP-dependent DNA helicase DinG